MAQPATLHGFHLDISDLDRGVYESVDLRVARHPSETVPHLVLRVLAYAMEVRPDLSFGRGVSTDEPALSAVDGTGRVLLWIDVGAPSADRLHKATKQADAVAVYSSRDLAVLGEALKGIHRAESVRLVGLPDAFLCDLANHLDRRNDWVVMHTDNTLYVTTAGATWEALVTHGRVGQGA